MMKKIFLLVAFFVLGKMWSYAQYPLQQNLGNDSTIVVSKGATQSRFVNVTYTDTASANLQRIRQYPASLIATTSGGLRFWIRNSDATEWIEISTTSSGSISGTTNYVPVFTSTNTIGNSIMYQSSGNIGINTITPQTSLDVSGSTRVSTNFAALSLNNSTSTTPIWMKINNGGGNYLIGASSSLGGGILSANTSSYAFVINAESSRDVVIGTDNLERMRVDATGKVGIGTTTVDSMLTVAQGVYLQKGVRMSGLPTAPGTKSLRIDANGTLSIADTTSGGGVGTVTSVATNNGTGITGGTITTAGTLAIDTLLISTRAWRQKGIDSLQANINGKLNISDTASMLSPYINNVGYGLGKTSQSVYADSATLSAYYLRRKDSLTTTNPLGYVTKKILADTASALRSAIGSGYVPYTGATQNVDLGQFGLKTKYVEFDTSSQAVTDRRLQWSNDDGTLQFGMTNGSTITQRIGLEQFARVKNVDNVQINKGQVVYLYGASGDRASVKLANSKHDSTSSKTLGVATENIPVNSVGLVGTFGTVGKLNNLTTFSPGDIVYLDSVSGQLTNVKPVAPYNTVFIGVVERNNSGNGLLFTNVQNGYELEELHNVLITSPVRNNAILVYDSTRRLWIDTTIAQAGLAVTQVNTNSATGITGGPITTTGTISADTLLLSTRAWRQKGIDSVAALINSNISGTTNYISKFTTNSTIGNSIMYELSSKVGINTTSPDVLLTLDGKTGGNSSVDLLSIYASKGQSDAAYLKISGTNSPTPDARYMTMNVFDGNNIPRNLLMQQTGGKVGIGAVSPSDNLHVFANNDRGLTLSNDTTGNKPTLTFLNTGSGSYSSYIQGNGARIAFGNLASNYSGYSQKMVLDSLGHLGIGTASPDSMLTVVNGAYFQRGVRMSGLPTAPGTKAVRIDANGKLSIADTTTAGVGTVTSVATNNGTGITGGTITTSGTLAIDTLLISTRAWRQKGIDSVAALPRVTSVGSGYGLSGGTITTSGTLLVDSATLSNYYLRRKDSLTATNLLGYVTRKILADTASAIRSAATGGTVTSVATNNGTGITGGTIVSTGTLAIDTLLISTRAWRQKGIDSVASLITGGYVPNSRTITINGTSQDLSANRTYNVGTVTSVATSSATGITGGTFTTSGTIAADTLLLSTRLWRQKGIDSVAALPRVTSVATNTGTGITGGTITTSGTIAADTLLLSTRAWRQKGIDSIQSNITSGLALKLNISDTATMLANYINSVGFGLSKTGQSARVDTSTLATSFLRRKDSLTATNLLGYVTRKILADTAAAIRSAGGTGTVTSVATNTGTGITGGTITTSGTLAIDTLLISTRAWRQKGIDSVQANLTAGLALKVNISDTASMLTPYLRKIDTTAMLSPYLRSNVASATYVPQTRTITINGTSQDLSANRTYNVGTVTSVATSSATGITGGTFTTSGTIAADTLLLSTRAWRQKGIDSVAALANTKISGSGTTNYIPKFTSSSAIGNSNLINDASGNLGLGVTPSAWSLGKAIDINGGPGILGVNNGTQITNNAYYNGGWIYKATSYAQNFVIDNDGTFKFYQAPSGTAGNAITFTQAMTLFSTGNLAVGGTSDNGYRLNVTGGGYFTGGSVFASGFNVNGASETRYYNANASNWAVIQGGSYTGSNLGEIKITGGSGNGILLTNSGNVGIGTTSPAEKLQVSGNILLDAGYKLYGNANSGSTSSYVSLYNATDGGIDLMANYTTSKITFGTNASERMRITAAGLVGIGTSSPSGRLHIDPADNEVGLNISTSSLTSANAQSLIDLTQTWNTTGNPTAIKLNVTNTASGTSSKLMDLQVGGTSQFQVTKGGAIQTVGGVPWKLTGSVVTLGGSNLQGISVDVNGTTYYLVTGYLPEPEPDPAALPASGPSANYKTYNKPTPVKSAQDAKIQTLEREVAELKEMVKKLASK